MIISTNFRTIIRDVRNSLVLFFARLPVVRTRHTGSLAILTYHRVLPIDHPDRLDEEPGIVVSPELFSQHLQWLSARYKLVRLEEWLNDPNAYADQQAVAITFDDGWQDNYDHALTLLRKHQVPATIFLVPAMIGQSKRYWPGLLMKCLRTRAYSSLPTRVFDAISNYCSKSGYALPDSDHNIRSDIVRFVKSKFSDREMNDACAQFYTNEDNPDCFSDACATELYNDPLISIGSHTYNHTRLNSLTAEQEQKFAIVEGNNALRTIENYGNIFCFPNGDRSEFAVTLVKEIHSAATTVVPGWNTPNQDKFSLKRFNIHDGNSYSKTALEYLLNRK